MSMSTAPHGPSPGKRAFLKALSGALFVIATLASLMTLYISFLFVRAALDGQEDDWAQPLLGLAIWVAVAIAAWSFRYRLAR